MPRRHRSISLAVAYIALVVVVFIAESMLAAVFIRATSAATPHPSAVAKRMGEGLVKGAYSYGPIFTLSQTGSATYVHAIYILLVNPNPAPVRVVVIGNFPGYPNTSLANMLEFRVISWIYRPEGAEIKEGGSWFVGYTKYMVMPPHESVSMLVEARYGYPLEAYACTPTGCSRLEHIGIMTSPVPGSIAPRPWTLSKIGTIVLPSIVEWSDVAWWAGVHGGNQIWCKPKFQSVTPTVPAGGECCPTKCPEGWEGVVFEGSDSICVSKAGYIHSWNQIFRVNYSTVFAGALSTRDNFHFESPTTPVFGKTPYPFSYSGRTNLGIEDTLTSFSRKEKMNLEIRLLRYVFAVSTDGSNSTMDKVWLNASKVAVYVWAMGYYGEVSLWNPYSGKVVLGYEKHMVHIEVSAILLDGSEVMIVNFTLDPTSSGAGITGGYVYSGDIKVWDKLRVTIGFRIKISYVIEGPKAYTSDLLCGLPISYSLAMGFYVDFIPVS